MVNAEALAISSSKPVRSWKLPAWYPAVPFSLQVRLGSTGQLSRAVSEEEMYRDWRVRGGGGGSLRKSDCGFQRNKESHASSHATLPSVTLLRKYLA